MKGPDILRQSFLVGGLSYGFDKAREGAPIEGYLEKRTRGMAGSGVGASWQRRYFVLVGGDLRYWNTQEEYMQSYINRQLKAARAQKPGITFAMDEESGIESRNEGTIIDLKMFEIRVDTAFAPTEESKDDGAKKVHSKRTSFKSNNSDTPGYFMFSLLPIVSGDGSRTQREWVLRTDEEMSRRIWVESLLYATINA